MAVSYGVFVYITHGIKSRNFRNQAPISMVVDQALNVGQGWTFFLKKKVNCFEIVGLRLNKNITIFSFVFTLGLQEAQ